MHFRFFDCSMQASASAISQSFSSAVVPWKQLTWHLHLAALKDQLQRIDASLPLPLPLVSPIFIPGLPQ
jgi:hypothetical protein